MPQQTPAIGADVTSLMPPVGADVSAMMPDFQSQNEKTPEGGAVVDPNTFGTMARHVGAQINPLAMGQLLPLPKSVGGAGWDAPLQALKNMGAAQGALLDKAKESYRNGDYVTAGRHAVDYLLPVIGPVLDKSSDSMQSGHYMAGIGDAVGLALAMFGPKAASEAAPDVAKSIRESTAGQSVADMADKGAEQRMVDVITPKVGANKVRFGNQATQVAGDVARETTGLSRTAIADSVAAKLEDATAALDAAHDSRLNAKSYPTKPVVDSLLAKRARLTAEAVDASKYPPKVTNLTPGGEETVLSTRQATPIGADVVPAPNAAQVAQIDQAIKEVQQLGPLAKYEALRRIRESYDGPAKAVYSPAMTADYMKAQGGKLGAADVTGALREHLATLDPNTAAANADYSLWKKASDVLTAAEETERVRPTVGRSLMARGLAAAVGGSAGGPVGAGIGAMIGPVIERAVAGVSPALKIVVARQLATLADALRAGDLGQAQKALRTVQKMVPATVAARSIALPAATAGMAQTPPEGQP